MLSATLSSKYQLCIPKLLRDQLHIKAGQKFIFISKGEIIHLVPVRNVKQVKGIMSGANVENYRDHEDRI